MLRTPHLTSSPSVVNRDFFEGQWHNLNDNLFSQAPDLFPQKSFSYERFLWAVATLRAHVHAPLQGTRVALVPLADLVSTPCILCFSSLLSAFQAMLFSILLLAALDCDWVSTLLWVHKHTNTAHVSCQFGLSCAVQSLPYHAPYTVQ